MCKTRANELLLEDRPRNSQLRPLSLQQQYEIVSVTETLDLSTCDDDDFATLLQCPAQDLMGCSACTRVSGDAGCGDEGTQGPTTARELVVE